MGLGNEKEDFQQNDLPLSPPGKQKCSAPVRCVKKRRAVDRNRRKTIKNVHGLTGKRQKRGKLRARGNPTKIEVGGDNNGTGLCTPS